MAATPVARQSGIRVRPDPTRVVPRSVVRRLRPFWDGGFLCFGEIRGGEEVAMIQAVKAGSDVRGRSERWSTRPSLEEVAAIARRRRRHPGGADLSRGDGGPGDASQRLSQDPRLRSGLPAREHRGWRAPGPLLVHRLRADRAAHDARRRRHAGIDRRSEDGHGIR